MSEKLPYEEQLDQAWDTLPLPNEDWAWKDMKRRLDKDDDDKIVVPPPRRGCGIGALLIGLLLLSGLWFILRPDRWFDKKHPVISQRAQSGKEENKIDGNKTEHTNNNSVKTNSTTDDQKSSNDNSTSAVPTTVNNDRSKTINNTNDSTKFEVKQPPLKNKTPGSEPLTIKPDPSIPERSSQPNPNTKIPAGQPVKTKKDNENPQPGNEVTSNQITREPVDQQKIPAVEKNLDNTDHEKKRDSLASNSVEVKTEITQPKDSTSRKIADSITEKKTDPIKSNTKPVKDKEKKPIFFSAGLGLHQQIPVAEQEWTTYGSLGRKGILSDYIPSINFRVEKQDRWFLQTEFRYGAPQHTRQVTYDQKISIDTFTQSIITNSSVLKKTFYHQVPVTFNYYVLPGWSVGTGLQWNRFYSAVAEQEVKRRRPGTTIDSVLSKSIVKVSNDSSSSFVKSWFQGIIQTQYQWKRFSIGARYSFSLQPYIKFTLPNQPRQQEKNSSFQIFLRYELWRSKN